MGDRTDEHIESLPSIAIAKPDLGQEEADAARDAVLSGWVTQGPQVAAFEREFAARTGVAHAVAVSNCTTALHLALLGAGVGDGDEVITVSHSFIATANVIRQCGAIPVFIDIDPVTFNINPALIQAAVTPRTRAILAVHQMGMPADMAAIMAVAEGFGLAVVEDAACAIGGAYVEATGTQRPIGKPFGQSVCFSFHPRKIITTGDGGMIATDDASLAQKFRLWRQHGMSVSDTVRHAATTVIFESYPELGFNYRMTDIQAAVGRPQLRRLDGIVARRRALASRYATLLRGISGVIPPAEPAYALSNWQTYCIRLPKGVDQRAVMQAMLNDGISTRRGVMCAHLEGAYAGLPHAPLPESEAAQAEGVCLPLHLELTEADLARVVKSLCLAIEQASQLAVG